MEKSKQPIGVMDSGVGGLSVVKRLQETLPFEDIVYFGDSIHCPYGLKSEKWIKFYTRKMTNFLMQNNVKAIVIACNTISTQMLKADNLIVPAFDIITPVCKEAENLSIDEIGVIATKFTVKTDCYKNMLSLYNPNITVVQAFSKNLATIIESADFQGGELEEEIIMSMNPITSRGISHVILGCTHYPLVLDRFKLLFPNITFYDPAMYQTLKLKTFLQEKKLVSNDESLGEFVYCTSGFGEFALKIMENMEIRKPSVLKVRQVL